VIRVQVAQQDRVDLTEPGVPLQGAERAVAEVENEPEVTGIDQVTGCRAVRSGKAAGPADNRYLHGRSLPPQQIKVATAVEDSLAARKTGTGNVPARLALPLSSPKRHDPE
jgi:hypothetical protein